MVVQSSLKTPKTKTWDKMSTMERRVALAQDVLDRLAVNKYRAKMANGYLEIARKWLRGKFTRNGEVNPEIQLQTVLQDIPTCTVCAKGGLFAAHIERNNKFKLCRLLIDDGTERTSDAGLVASECQMIEQLDDSFTREALDAIECAFEGEYSLGSWHTDSNLKYAAAKMFGPSIGAKERLTRICNNIIRNEGLFDVPNYGKV